MSEPRFRVLDALGGELDRAIARERRRRRVPLRMFALTLLASLSLAGVAAATSYLLTGSPLPGAHARDVPDESTPLRGTARLMGLDAADPGGGRPWDVRVSRSRTGQLCTAVGQVANGTLGIVGLDGRFRALPQLGNDTCGQAPTLLGARVFDAPRRADVRTVVNGVAGAGVARVVVEGAGERRTLELGPEGTFITVFAGYPEDVAPVVHLDARRVALASSDRPRALDPVAGAWTVSVSGRVWGSRKGQTCAQVERERERDPAPYGLSYPVCGDLREDPFFFEVAPLPRAQELRGGRPARAWGFRAPRTMVWGAAGPEVQRITIAGKPVDLSGQGPGFVAAFPEGTRPADLPVEITLAGGETRRLVGGQNLRGADGSRLPVALREPVVIPAALRHAPAQPRTWLSAQARTARIARRFADPAGGPDWAVRTFSARVAGAKQRLRCAQVGRLVDGRLRRPDGREPLALDDPSSACVPLGRNPRREPVSRIDTFVDDASAYAPKPLRTVVWGTAGPTGRRVDVGGQRVPLGPGGAFLAFFAPGQDLVVRTTYADGHRHSVERFRSRRARVVPGSERITARAPDPDGGAPYGMLEWRTAAGATCRAVDRIVGDTVGALFAPSNRFLPYPVHEGGSCADTPPTRSQPLVFSRSTDPDDGDAESARVRRTLPGRTIISGTAHPDVREITIQTPRDVRTLRPAGPGRSFLAVYDGEFFRGEITLTARFADGTTHRQVTPVG